MKSSPSRKPEKVAYYARNIMRDLAPQRIFRRRLDGLLRAARDYDPAYLRSRLHFYNKITGAIALPADAATVGGIPMFKSMYYYDLKEHARYFPRHFRLCHFFGDQRISPPDPSFAKSRAVAGDNRNSVLMKLVKFRHFHFPPDDIPFADKTPRAVWRGGIHNHQRHLLVSGYFDHPLCDVGKTGGGDDAFRRDFLEPHEQMQFKYVISVEGFDVATNLKWVLASNSLCLMPRPTCETWFMESRLEPGKHYAELRGDFADLEERILHFEKHPDEALAIIANANLYAAEFFDERREQILSLLVMYKYFVGSSQIEPDDDARALIGLE
jgi:hypothetical protein